ncbi:glutamate synthase domain-containing protein 2 [Methanohalophilus euhalobius]|uniref:Glutamate synthase domain-containing protein 2 n=1 Tax=Methanohalophilus euhalobius TaxID=51203 RepID=A0A285FYS5_9EURY|nr:MULTISPECIES: glutamate synthase-related protein [Methanohalophilus]ODV50332.1 MAG: glutamate synthase (NADPH) GltB2 subunit [Methanohalophilus sp. 2-GBenrich]RSD36214.1 MAG: glutamate synthase (NADPH) GltB2 subunit [Methanohalophilus sp.]TCL11735.1 glutamate synthase domain-containing protein 2 [Methanohalophilus euhalobius]SNY16243.1 Glutamate synthase domain-containing protein 2 [Methanohalophilus euhalobius]
MGNLRQPNANEATRTFNRSKSVSPMSGICTRCVDGCRGNCEIFKSSFRGREVLYPGPFGEITAGADKEYPVDYSHLNIQGYAVGAVGLPEGMEASPETARFPNVDTETEYGWNKKVKMRLPAFTGALGSTDIARKNWNEFAVGAAITGITLVCGENVCGIDPELKRDNNGLVTESPEMDRRIAAYNKFHEGYGEMLVQMNVEDTKLGVAEYISSKHEMDTLELKWGQGAKCIGGEIKVRDLDRALELKRRGYIVTPDPENAAVQEAYKVGAIREFERHSRLGFVDKEGFLEEVDRLRSIGYDRITLKTGAYSMVEAAMALKYSSEAKIDLLTFDGAPGGTGMSPWPMMEEWGIPTFYLQSLVYEFAEKLNNKGERVPDLAMAGGFSSEDGIYKALAMGSPYFKAVCMGRGLMIPGMVGKNIGKWLDEDNLPKTVSEFGHRPEEIFVHYEDLEERYGEDVKDIPLGAMGIYSYGEKLKVGLQQLMAGSRRFNINTLSRKDVMALTEEAAEVSGIDYVMNAYRDVAEQILDE